MSTAKVTWRNYAPKFGKAPKLAPAKKLPANQTTETSMRFADVRSQNSTVVYVINVEDGRSIDAKADDFIKRMYNSFSRAQEE